MVQGLCKTPSHREQGSRTLAHLVPKSTILPAGGTTSNLQVPRVLHRDPKKKHPQNSLGCRIINTSPAHAHCNLRAAPGYNRTHCACAVRFSLRGTRQERGIPVVPRRQKNGSAAAARSPFPCFLPRSASWLPLTVTVAPAASAAFPRATQKGPSRAHYHRARLTTDSRLPRPSLPRVPFQPTNIQGAHLRCHPAERI